MNRSQRPVPEVFDGDAPAGRARKRRTRTEFEKAVYRFHSGDARGALQELDALHVEEDPDPPVEIYRGRCARALRLDGAAAGANAGT
ncbi:MAG TPA: hypothetical protein VMQ10_13325 [Spirochaetia bacterium]|nr:hypothetical protein [Spirochaetia bacterium]